LLSPDFLDFGQRKFYAVNEYSNIPGTISVTLTADMKKNTVILILAALVLGGIYVLKFTDWFSQKNIQILFTNRGGNVFFGLEGKEYELTAIKVYRADEIATNKYPHALWHVVAATNSAPVADFLYGQDIPGMKPSVAGLKPEPLKAKTEYKIIVEAGKMKGERVFSIQ
jgi:hypothetical protein